MTSALILSGPLSPPPPSGVLSAPPPCVQGLTSLECPANRLARLPPSLLQHSLLLSLDLASNGMHELPRTVRCLVHLRRLDLRTNQLKRTLYVSHNRLRELPEELSCLVSLTLLDASMNCLMLLPRHWERLKDLQCLMFNENKAGNSLVSLPSALGHLSCLSSLRLAHNALATADSCAALCAATSITCLSLEHNSLRELPPELGGMSSLRLLDVSCNQLLCLPAQFSGLVALRHLYASRNRLRRLPSQLGDLPQLETLDVSWNRLTGVGVCELVAKSVTASVG
ncbi:hypothetical protein QJQ45_011514 [Haematococcus lacustris]|nr:hypothetical protein QJQ45_011514 [Haematococcus lacustris]